MVRAMYRLGIIGTVCLLAILCGVGVSILFQARNFDPDAYHTPTSAGKPSPTAVVHATAITRHAEGDSPSAASVDPIPRADSSSQKLRPLSVDPAPFGARLSEEVIVALLLAVTATMLTVGSALQLYRQIVAHTDEVCADLHGVYRAWEKR